MQFTQLDMELAFTDSEGIMRIAEQLITGILRQACAHPVPFLLDLDCHTMSTPACYHLQLPGIDDELCTLLGYHNGSTGVIALFCSFRGRIRLHGHRLDLPLLDFHFCISGLDAQSAISSADAIFKNCDQHLLIILQVSGINVSTPIQQLTFQEAMLRFGTDKPDLRYGLELADVTHAVRGCSFRYSPLQPWQIPQHAGQSFCMCAYDPVAVHTG